MKNVIFGSGIVGMVAKKVLRGNWTIVPFSKSRFYSHFPPLADNFISVDKDIDLLMKDLTGNTDVHFYRKGFSVNGELVTNFDGAVCGALLHKMFGNRIPSQSIPYMKNRMTMPVYRTRANELYLKLQAEHQQELVSEAGLGQVTEIGKHYFVRNGVKQEFDHAICTIPLPVLMGLMGLESQLTALPEHFVLVRSSKIDLEGCNQVFVADRELLFYKVVNISKGFYVFCSLVDIPNPGAYLMPIVGLADIVDGTMIDNAVPSGDMPDLGWLVEYGISCVGSYALWDWCADVGSNLLKLVRVSSSF